MKDHLNRTLYEQEIRNTLTESFESRYSAVHSSKSFNYGFGSSNVLLGIQMAIDNPIHPTAAMPDAAEVAKDGGHDGVHALGKDTVTSWKPFAGNDQLRMPASFGPGPNNSQLLFDELIVHSEERVGIKFVLVVERVD